MLAGRFTVPDPPRGWVPRPRLLARLDGIHDHSLTLLCAPAGSGKTALLSGWLAAGRARGGVCWVSLDPTDSTRRGLWTSLLTAVRSFDAAGPLGSLEVNPGASPDVLAAPFLERVERLDSPLVIVLDDAHEAGPDALSILRPLLRRDVPGLRLVVATRAEPELPVGRLRLERRLLELRARELAFDARETGELLRAFGVSLPDHQRARLQQRTEGWPAAVALAAHSLSLRADGAPTEDFGGQEQTIADYLVGEILDRHDPQTRAFLLRTSIADPVDGDVADAITGRDDGARTLQRLHRQGVPLVAVGAPRESFRYHALFAELLAAQLRLETSAGEVRELHRRAARWYDAHDALAAALAHALRADDLEHACAIARRDALRLVIDGSARLLVPLLAHLAPGDEVVDAGLAVALALAELDRGLTDGRWLRVARARSGDVSVADRDAFEAALTAAELHAARLEGRLDDVRAGARRLANRHVGLPDPTLDAGLRALADVGLGVAELWRGELARAMEQLEDGLTAARAARRDWLVLLAAGDLALACGLACEAQRCERAAELAIEIATRRGWMTTLPAAAALLAQADLAQRRLQPHRAEELLEQAAAVVDRSGDRALAATAALIRTQLLLTRGRTLEASAAWRAALALADEDAADANVDAQLQTAGAHAAGPLRDLIASIGAQVRLAAGDRVTARELLERERAACPASARTCALLARLELEEGAVARARELIAPLLVTALSACGAACVDAWLVEARALDCLGDLSGASRALEQALDGVEASGAVAVVVLHGRALEPLLRRQAGPDTTHRELVERLRGLLGGTPRTSLPAGLPEALTVSELRVLRYLPTLMSYDEIAGELCVSRNTLKSHTRAIFRKLDAHNRRDAIDHGRRLGLLRPADERVLVTD